MFPGWCSGSGPSPQANPSSWGLLLGVAQVLQLKAVYIFKMDGVAMWPSNYVIPTKLKRLEAFLRGDAAVKVEFEIPKNVQLDGRLGPYTLLPKNVFFRFDAMLGFIPVMIKFSFEAKVEATFSMQLRLPEPIIGGGGVSLNVKYGGLLRHYSEAAAEACADSSSSCASWVQSYNCAQRYTIGGQSRLLSEYCCISCGGGGVGILSDIPSRHEGGRHCASVVMW